MADLPVITFIQERLSESDTSLDTRKGSGFYDLFIKPQQLMLQPLFTSMETTLTSQSVRRMRNLPTPDTFDETLVDDAVGNVYIERTTGDFARTVVRAYYLDPVDREFPAFTAEFSSGTLSFFNETDVVITSIQMATQTEGTLYYVDLPVRAQVEGDSYNVPAGSITTFVNDPQAVNVTSLSDAIGGLPRETNTLILDRAKNSIGVRDLETVKGINAILHERFAFVREVKSIGMGDPEMMRDIIYNVHNGGNTDVYIRTSALQHLTKNVIGVGYDYTRELPKNVHMELIARDFSDPLADLNTPNIVSTSVSVKEDTIETAATLTSVSIPVGSPLNLSTGQWVRISIDGGAFKDVKVAGAIPASTQRFEIINSINAAFGLTIATAIGSDKVRLSSPTVGLSSSIVFASPVLPRTDGTLLVFPQANTLGGYVYNTTNGTFTGLGPTIYIENVDYQVNYLDGKIIKLPGSAITSGDIVANHPVYGTAPPQTVPPRADTGVASMLVLTTNTLTVGVMGAFSTTRAGDSLFITAATYVPTGEYIVQSVVSDTEIKVLGLIPSTNDYAIQYYIVSNQAVVVDYRYNPISIDIGANVLLPNGTRGVRPGREAFTITAVPFVGLISIEEIDPDTTEGLGVFLVPPGGWGSGGYGMGGYGRSKGGEYRFVVNVPTARFSVFEDALIALDTSLFGRSYRVTYFGSPEIASIHTIARDDLERVTGADVLPKNFVPGFVDITIGIRRDPTNLSTPDNAGLASLVSSLINEVPANMGLKASDIIKMLEDKGVDSVQTPFDMKATVFNTDGSTSIYINQDILVVEPVTLPKETSNFVTSRIVHFYGRTISVVEV